MKQRFKELLSITTNTLMFCHYNKPIIEICRFLMNTNEGIIVISLRSKAFIVRRRICFV